MVKRLIAERGTGLEVNDEELEEPDDPELPPWLLDEGCVDVASAVAGVEDARLMLLEVEEDEVGLLVDKV